MSAKQEDSELIVFLASSLSPEDIQLYYQIGLYGKRDLPLAPDPASGFEMTMLRMLSFRPEDDAPASSGGSSGAPPAERKSPPEAKRRGALRPKAPEVSPKEKSAGSSSSRASSEPTMVTEGVKKIAQPAQSGASEKAAGSIKTAEGWAAFVEQAGLSGVTKELAMNLAPVGFDDQKKL